MTPEQHAAYVKFWSGPTDELRAKIVNPEQWDAERSIHLAQIFGGLPPLTTPANILEIGCGIGRLLGPLHEAGHRCAGLDISADMIYEAYHANPGPTYYRLKPPAYLWPSDIEAADVVFSLLCFQHIPTRELVEHYLQSALRATKPLTGRLRVQTLRAEPNTHAEREPSWHGYTFPTLGSFASMVESCGWDVVLAESGLGHPDWLWITARPR